MGIIAFYRNAGLMIPVHRDSRKANQNSFSGKCRFHVPGGSLNKAPARYMEIMMKGTHTSVYWWLSEEWFMVPQVAKNLKTQ